MENENIKNLREALKFSPDNVPLRLHLANTLLENSLMEEAEQEYKIILDQSPANLKAKEGLAQVYYSQGKHSAVIVIVEDLVDTENESAEILLLYSKALFKENDVARSMEYYKKALALDPDKTDDELDANLRNKGGFEGEVEQFLEELEEEAGRLERPKINFDDVGGMDKVKEEINIKIIQPLKHPELYEAYGKKIGGGILLYGPPGCGKTHIARATAGQVKAKFIPVGISDVLDMWIGNSERNLHNIFELARNEAPCVLFFDEIDALGASRSDMRQSGGRHLINQFLSELDGVESSNDGVLILGATNAPWHLDPAFRRPGRFDRIIFVQPPDIESRESILEVLLKNKPLGDIDYASVAKKAKDFSGADLKALIDYAIEEKLRASMKTGVPEPIQTKDLVGASKMIKPSTKEWFTSARNYALYANDSGLYDEILEYLNIKK
ncbi:MAG: AAA family ATPase [Bacteroidota bacterium]